MNATLTNTEARAMMRNQPVQNTTINRIMTLTGEVPDADRYRNYLSTLKTYELESRLKTMEAEQTKRSPDSWNVTR